MPSIFHSAAAGDTRSKAAATVGAEAASIGRSGRPTCRRKAWSAARAAALAALSPDSCAGGWPAVA